MIELLPLLHLFPKNWDVGMCHHAVTQRFHVCWTSNLPAELHLQALRSVLKASYRCNREVLCNVILDPFLIFIGICAKMGLYLLSKEPY